MTASMAFALSGEGTDTLELEIYDDIGGGGLFSDGVSAKSVRAQLKANRNAKEIQVRINSAGGSVLEGFAIYNLLTEHPARVVADVDAIAASIASLVLMAADEIRMSESAMIMVHNPWGMSMGEAQDLRATADLLDKMREQMGRAYASRTGLSEEECLAMMEAETYLSADEAKAKGFADVVKTSKRGAMARAMAHLDLSELKVPARFAHLLKAAASKPCGPQPPTQKQPSAPRAEESIEMDEKQILNALGVSSIAEASAQIALAKGVQSATGKSGDDATGLIRAAMQSHTELPKAQARIKELEQKTEEHELDRLFAKAKEEKRLTPAIEKSVRDAFAASEVTLKGAEVWLSNSPVIAALSTPTASAQPPATNASGALTYNGKTYAEMKPTEKAALAKEDNALFEQMRAAS